MRKNFNCLHEKITIQILHSIRATRNIVYNAGKLAEFSWRDKYLRSELKARWGQQAAAKETWTREQQQNIFYIDTITIWYIHTRYNDTLVTHKYSFSFYSSLFKYFSFPLICVLYLHHTFQFKRYFFFFIFCGTGARRTL